MISFLKDISLEIDSFENLVKIAKEFVIFGPQFL
jgi:hypothetical protein